MNRDNIRNLINKLLIGRSVVFLTERHNEYPGYILELDNTCLKFNTDVFKTWEILYLTPCMLSSCQKNLYHFNTTYKFETLTSFMLLHKTLMKLNSDLPTAYNLAYRLNLLLHLADDKHGASSGCRIAKEGIHNGLIKT